MCSYRSTLLSLPTEKIFTAASRPNAQFYIDRWHVRGVFNQLSEKYRSLVWIWKVQKTGKKKKKLCRWFSFRLNLKSRKWFGSPSRHYHSVATIFKTKIVGKVYEVFEWISVKSNSYLRCSHWSQFGLVFIAVDKKQLSASVFQIALIEQFILIANIDFLGFNTAREKGFVYKIFNQKFKLSVNGVLNFMFVHATHVMKEKS